jgi:hypothetical protein
MIAGRVCSARTINPLGRQLSGSMIYAGMGVVVSPV